MPHKICCSKRGRRARRKHIYHTITVLEVLCNRVSRSGLAEFLYDQTPWEALLIISKQITLGGQVPLHFTPSLSVPLRSDRTMSMYLLLDELQGKPSFTASSLLLHGIFAAPIPLLQCGQKAPRTIKLRAD